MEIVSSGPMSLYTQRKALMSLDINLGVPKTRSKRFSEKKNFLPLPGHEPQILLAQTSLQYIKVVGTAPMGQGADISSAGSLQSAAVTDGKFYCSALSD